MIAIAKCASVRSSSTPDGQKHVPTRHEQFLSLLPAIRRHAQIRFQFLDEERARKWSQPWSPTPGFSS